ncbi:kinetochore-associated protein DSN1 homolog isoform X2 [Echeneis naucrates]|uniref:kinetochore-associated protein DSN1 homolog isoform X2 n=1 Tax=Echeneis naucrates TaxID=173247 RepID=UPI001113F2EB|nr:uncharacterized protein LOC115047632 isoform X2 [Echeneis naucrates]
MAEKHIEAELNGYGNAADAENQDDVDSATPTLKRCSSNASANTALPQKHPRTDSPLPSTLTPDKQEMQPEDTEEASASPVSPTARRKSWRRATITRRSLPALPNPYHDLCRSINTSLPQQERLEKLMEASMKLAIERTRNSLQSMPNASLECFQKQVDDMQKQWSSLAKSIQRNSQGNQLHTTAPRSCDPAVQRAMEKVQKAIRRLEAESESWEALLNKHQSKAEELERKLERGQERGVSLDTGSVAQSSQHLFIQNKPDYPSLICKQQMTLHTIAMIMDTQCKMVRELLSIKEQSQLLVKETSGRLAVDAGFQELSPDPIRNLMAAPSSSTAV